MSMTIQELYPIRSDRELILDCSIYFEQLFTSIYGAKGEGLNQKLRSIKSSELPPKIRKKAHFLANARNRVIYHAKPLDRAKVHNAFREIQQFLIDSKRKPIISFQAVPTYPGINESNISFITSWYEYLENKFVELLSATGSGLQNKISSIQNSLPHSIVKKARYVATMRNQLFHQGENIDQQAVYDAAQAVHQHLSTPTTPNPFPVDYNYDDTIDFDLESAAIGCGLGTIIGIGIGLLISG